MTTEQIDEMRRWSEQNDRDLMSIFGRERLAEMYMRGSVFCGPTMSADTKPGAVPADDDELEESNFLQPDKSPMDDLLSKPTTEAELAEAKASF
jgi:hypothetical protein